MPDKTLVVLVPDYRGNPETLEPLFKHVQKSTNLENLESLPFPYPLSPFINRDPEDIADNLNAKIQNYVREHPEINKIILVGHSMGSTLVRRAFLDASGYGSQIDRAEVWASRVERIVLLGALGRGFEPDKFVGWRMRLWLVPLINVASLLNIGEMLRSMLRGADYISKLRVDWTTYSNSEGKKPLVVHVLGANDAIVKKDDVIDLEEFPNAITEPVPDAGHFDVVIPNPKTSSALTRAFTDIYQNSNGNAESQSKKRIIILMHGIRDSRKCFEDLAEKLKSDPDNEVKIPSYGYFSARRFLSTRARNALVPRLVDEITDALARNPKAKISYAGHSNGTYLLGETLERLPRLKLDRVYLAASVLPTNYKWQDVIGKREQVQKLRCDMGTEDYPVGFFCKGLNELGIKSLGSGGSDEFEYGGASYVEYNRFNGGHGAMLTNENFDTVYRFICGSEYRRPAKATAKPSQLFRFATRYSGVILALALTLILLLIVLMYLYTPASYKLFLTGLAILVLWSVLGRF